jgi:hypothetical protein
MASNFYRVYLYVVFLAMLIFAAVGLGWLLQSLLALTALRGTYGAVPTSMDLVQHIVFFGVSWLIAGVLGGLHYWLIRRDMRQDADAGDSGVRAFFLNLVELVVAPLGIGITSSAVIPQLGQTYSGDLSGTTAFALSALALFVVLELERRRKPAEHGVALFFQRFHLYGVQFILLNILVFTWIYAFTLLFNVIVYNGQAGGSVVCVGFVACEGQNLFSALAATLWAIVFWIGYGWLSRGDAPSLFRRIMHYGSLAFGVGYLLFGLHLALDLAFRHIAGVEPTPQDTVTSFNFGAYILLGALVIGIYLYWLRSTGRREQDGLSRVSLNCQVVFAALMAGAFYWGIGYLLLNALEWPATSQDWSTALSLVVTGIGYIALDILLDARKRKQVSGSLEARRAFVFALLGGGILAAAIGGAVALYALLTSAFGSPVENWPHLEHSGLAAFLAGAFVLAVYFLRARRESLFRALTKPLKQPVTAPMETGSPAQPAVLPAQPPAKASSSSIESILDDLLANRITRDEAVERLQARSQEH